MSQARVRLKEVKFGSPTRAPGGSVRSQETFVSNGQDLLVEEDDRDVVLTPLRQGKPHPEFGVVRVARERAVYRLAFPPEGK